MFAIQMYPFLARELLGNKSSEGNISNSGGFEHILVKQTGGITTIILNRPRKYNAVNSKVNIFT